MSDMAGFYGERAERVVAALKKNLFDALYVPTGEQAVEEIMKRIPEAASVGVGGSLTLRRLGIVELLKKRGHEVYDHWQPGLEPGEVNIMRRRQLTSDVFLSSTNAVTAEGHLVNIDGVGNRVASMTFGPGKVIVAAGINKIVRDQKAAMERIKSEAAPLNFMRLNLATPCTKTTFCSDCSSPARGCKVTVVTEAKPGGIPEFSVIIVGERLGF